MAKSANSCYSQSFMNLNFESAYNLPSNPGEGELVSVANALPNWAAFDDTTPLSYIYYVTNFLNNVSGPVELDGGSLALSGNFSVELFNNCSINQTGLVPDNAESLEFEAEGPGEGGTVGASGFSVTLGGETLSYSAISSGPDYTVYGANIPSGMDGQTENLAFICQGPGSGSVTLDNIEFSSTGVPEPSANAMIGLGAILFVVHHHRKRRKVCC